MKIPVWAEPSTQFSEIGRHLWSVSRLHQLARDLPVLEIPLDHLNIWHKYHDLTLREFVMHMRAVQAADLAFPIILDEDGEIMDGRHRIMRAMLECKPTILAVRFDENPPPCRVKDA